LSEVSLDVGIDRRIAGEKFEQFARIAERARHAFHAADLIAQVGQLLHRALRTVRIVPEALIARAQFELADRACLARVVKDAP
jgi:hypothetical protein